MTASDTAARQGPSGTSKARFALTLSPRPQARQSVSVHVATADGTATIADGDYDVVSTTVTWGPTDPLTKYVNVTVNGDSAAEPNETFFLHVSSPAPGALVVIYRPKATATIVVT